MTATALKLIEVEIQTFVSILFHLQASRIYYTERVRGPINEVIAHESFIPEKNQLFSHTFISHTFKR